MTPNQRYYDDRNYVVSTTAHVFRLVHNFVSLVFYLAGFLFVGCFVYALGWGLVEDPVSVLKFWGPVFGLIGFWIYRQWKRESKIVRLTPEQLAERKAALYAANAARRAEEFPDDVFHEHAVQWEKEQKAA